MNGRLLRSLCVSGAVVAVALAAPRLAAAQAQATADVPTPLRTAWGDPDLQGTWDNRTITPLERPPQFADTETLTAEEAARYEASIAERRVDDRYYWNRGTRVVGDRRTSLIVDPPNGRVPSLTRAGQRRLEAGRTQGTDGPEQRNPSER